MFVLIPEFAVRAILVGRNPSAVIKLAQVVLGAVVRISHVEGRDSCNAIPKVTCRYIGEQMHIINRNGNALLWLRIAFAESQANLADNHVVNGQQS